MCMETVTGCRKNITDIYTFLLFIRTRIERAVFLVQKDSNVLDLPREILMKNLLNTGNSPEKRLRLTKKDNCVKGLRLLCRRVFLLKLSGYMFE